MENNEIDVEEYIKRTAREIKLIKEKGFSRYFLIVNNLVLWARKENIPVGPGRGSVCGSIVAFLMGITQVDSLKYNLSFSRFLNDKRVDVPDIDLDFSKVDRGKVIEYIKQTYGETNTCGISTIGRMRAKAVVRDVCRVMDVPGAVTNNFASTIWKTDDGSSPITASIKKTREGKAFQKNYPGVVKLATKLENQARNAGVHAAGIIISDRNLKTSGQCVLVKRKGNVVCNWDKKDSEYCGLMKLDVLGLSTLSVLDHAKKLIGKKGNQKSFYYRPESNQNLFLNVMTRELENRYKNCKEIAFDFNKISLKDAKTFAMLSRGETSGVFQLSGKACTSVSKDMGIHSFDDIVAVTALARPGPADAGITKEYIERKHGKKWVKKNSIYEDITKDTMGLVIYQEQISEIISKVAGLSSSIADSIRKIITKKGDVNKLKVFWEQFKDGCLEKQTLSLEEAEDFWNELQKHASYLFNKSHAVAYSLISYWCAYLKTHCEKEFYAGSLSFGEAEIEPLLSEIKSKGYEVLPVKRTLSDALCWKFIGKKLYAPFIEIVGIGESNALKCSASKKKVYNIGFFGEEIILKKRNKLEQILYELDVDNEKMPSRKIIKKYIPTII